MSFNLSTTSPALLTICLTYLILNLLSYPNECEMGAHCGFHLHIMLSTFFMCLLASWVPPLKKCLLKSSMDFGNWVLLLLNCKSSLYILDRSPLSDTWLANILSHSEGNLFTFLMTSLEVQKFLIVMKSNLSTFLLACAFGVISKKSLPDPSVFS